MLLKKLGWWDELTDAEKKAAEARTGRPTLGRHHPRGDEEPRLPPVRQRAKARAVVWNFPDAIPQHREPISPARTGRQVPTHDDKKAFWRLPTLYKSVQDKATSPTRSPRSSRWCSPPAAWSSSRAAATETRVNRGSPSCSRRTSSRSIRDANDRDVATASTSGSRRRPARRSGQGAGHWSTASRRAPAFIPFHFSGLVEGKDMLETIPEGAAPIVRGRGGQHRDDRTATTR